MTETTPPYRYVDGDSFCLSARLLPDLTTGGVTDTLSITIEGSDEPQSVHVPAGDVPAVAAGIVAAAGQQPAATVPASTPTDQARWQQYADAMDAVTGGTCPADLVQAVIVVADAEQAELRAENARMRHELEVMYGGAFDKPTACSDPIECSHEAALGQAEAAIARVRSVLEWEHVLGRSALDYRGLITAALMADAASGPGRADGETRSYAERVNAPLSESTITALNQRLRAGDTPVHTVRRWADGETQQDEDDLADRYGDDHSCADAGCSGEPTGQPAAVSQPGKEASVCGPGPDRCDAETGEPCAKHEIEQSHVEGDHSLCRSVDCEVLRQP